MYILYITVSFIFILLYLFYSKNKYSNETISDLHTTISDNKASITTLEDTIKQKDLTIQELSISEREYTDNSKNESEIVPDLQHFETLRRHFERYSIYDAINKVINANKELTGSKELLNDAQWEMFEEAVADMLPHLIKELHNERYSLNDKNYRFCCLLCLGFNFTEIAYVFGCTPQAINKRKNKIFKKMEVDSLKELEILINNFRKYS
jgi:DNA-binding CsgD family transcriptional regulator